MASENRNESKTGEVLVAILNNELDFTIARDQHWYRIPMDSAEKRLRDRWPPKWLAFYHTLAFPRRAHAVYFYARVREIKQAHRFELFPNLPKDEKWDRLYFQVFLEPLRTLEKPIVSRRRRRIVFIPTTWEKFMTAVEINDLYLGSPLEDRLWAGLLLHNYPPVYGSLLMQDRRRDIHHRAHARTRWYNGRGSLLSVKHSLQVFFSPISSVVNFEMYNNSQKQKPLYFRIARSTEIQSCQKRFKNSGKASISVTSHHSTPHPSTSRIFSCLPKRTSVSPSCRI